MRRAAEPEGLTGFAEAVIEVVESIPAGKVLSYGDVAELLGRGGPRAVGTVLARYGSGVPWWRVLRASGLPPRCHEQAALRHYAEEGTPVVGGRVVMSQARWAGPAPPDQTAPAEGCDGDDTAVPSG
jgi:alkylated DNA nucleotide flippase Atl1